MDKLSDRGIPVYAILQEKFGVLRSKLADFSKEGNNTAKILAALEEAFLSNPMFNGSARRDMDTTNGQLVLLKNNWNNFVTKLSEATDANSVFVGVLKTLNETLNFLAENAKTVANVLAGLAAAGITFGIVKITAAMWGLVVALKAVQLNLVKTGIGALIVGIGTAVAYTLEKLDEMSKKWSDSSGKVVSSMNIIQTTWEETVDAIGEAWDQVIAKIAGEWESIKQLFSGDLGFSEFVAKFNQFASIDPLQPFEGTADKIRERAIALGKDAGEGMQEGMKQAAKNTGKGEPEEFGPAFVGPSPLSDINNMIADQEKLLEAAKQGEEAYNKQKDALERVAEAAKLYNDTMKDVEKWNENVDADLGITGADVDALVKKYQDLEAATKEQQAAWEQSKGPIQQYRDNLLSLNDSLENVAVVGLNMLEDGLVGLITGTQSVQEAFSNMATAIVSELARAAIQAAIIKPLLASFGFAQGGVIAGGMQMTKYAKGGVVSSPTIFPMANGMGLMGEAGPEAVMPLTRTASGDLGVRSIGGGSGSSFVNNFNTNVTVQTQPGQDLSDPKVVEQLSKQIQRNQEALVTKTLQQQMRVGGVLNPTLSL